MPEDPKKQDKRKNDPKEQRKPRNSRNQAGKPDRKTEKVEESKSAPKVPQKPPIYEDPGPEFYKNLKRETEEILKITEEENAKYKKKEIQSNWSKYEMPIESYEEIEEHDLGADYEKLIQAPLSIGGHFQFKHEKSWDVNTGPSLYDKYFEINMDNLSLAVSTIPFFERNNIEKSLFTETDMLSMNNRATKYKQKYYDDKSYSTPDMEAEDRILNSLKEGLRQNKEGYEKVENIVESQNNEKILVNIEEDRSREDNIILDFNYLSKTDMPRPADNEGVIKDEGNSKVIKLTDEEHCDPIEELTLENKAPIKKVNKEKVDILNAIKTEAAKSLDKPTKVTTISEITGTRSGNTDKLDNAAEKNPVIESPEDLEKWLDDFLDG